MKRVKILALAALCALGCTACGGEKNITVIARTRGSGTREAFDKVVTDGEHFLEEKNEKGNKVYNTTLAASELNTTEAVTSMVSNDKNAIGYISLGSLDERVKAVKINGITPSFESVLAGEYSIQRPFVIMTGTQVTLTPLAAEFMQYLESSELKKHAQTVGCVFLEDEERRANEGEQGIPVSTYERKESLPTGKIVIRGSTSMEKLINEAAKGFAEEYNVSPTSIFDVQLVNSSSGRKAAKEDSVGNVIALSSAWVAEEGIRSFNACLDAVVVIVNKGNEGISDLTLKQLYDIFSGKVKKFSEIASV